MSALDASYLEDNNIPMVPEEIRKLIHGHLAACREAAQRGLPLIEHRGEPLSLEDWRHFCQTYLSVDTILPPELLQQWLRYLQQDANLKVHFPAGYSSCLAVIPVSEYGKKLEEDSIQQGGFLKPLTVELAGKTYKEDGKERVGKKGKTTGFTEVTSYIFKLLPLEVQEQCSFEIQPYAEGPTHEVTPADRERIISQFEKAFKNAQGLFNNK